MSVAMKRVLALQLSPARPSTRTGQQQEAARPMESSQEEMGTTSGWAKGTQFHETVSWEDAGSNRPWQPCLLYRPIRFQGAHETEPLKPRDTVCILARSGGPLLTVPIFNGSFCFSILTYEKFIGPPFFYMK